ncbi:DNA polymerase I [Sandaracinobacteroides saxicola]|uniref:DNA polymerase I n=1 Tax=Sandaracinobacteroides saxicola TaxID=2759707 RepID=A0A7G5II42_9SPHN|nr:DNA polymerase I [Sandaracinobacteroides saxicola]QMW23034.1 DNA polymerase I [Sandaracinobacteroides saxicola]
MTAPHLTLVDGSGFIFRAYHRLPPLTDPQGVPVGAVFGFTAMMWNLIEAARKSPEDDYLAVILDAGKRSFRHDIYAEYKANRPDPPEDLLPQFPLIRDAVRALSVPCIERDMIEADDLIASYAEAGIAAGMSVTIVSSDKDLMQLVRPGLSLLDTMQNKRFGEAEVLEKWGVPAAQLGDLLALMGDSVDNVPGVPGVGPKTAADLIKEFGSLEGVLGNLEAVKRPKLREALAANVEAVRLSRVLVDLKRDCALDPPLEALKLPESQAQEVLADFLAKHGFRSLLAKLGTVGTAAADSAKATRAASAPPSEAPPAVPFDHAAYETVTTVERLEDWIADARKAGVVAFDTETSALDAMRADIVGFSLATAPGRACYVPLAHVSGEGLYAEPVAQLDKAVALAAVKPLLEDPSVLKVGQNLKYDLIVMRRLGVDIAPFDDTMLLSYALDAGNHNSHGMDELSVRHLSHTPISFKEVAGTGKGQVSFGQVPLDRATAYAAEDADVTLRLHGALKPRLADAQVTRAYEWCDRPLVPVLADMEMAGIKVDRAELARLSALYAAEIERLEGEVHALAGGAFTIGSPKQLGEVLFDRLKLPGGKKSGKSGQYGTDVTELERLAALPEGGIARLVLDWRQNSKLRSTYTEALQNQINPDTGRVHTSFSMAVASTGRLASTDPNLQNIPIRTELGRRIRYAFVAEAGHRIMAADYNQIELRLMAHIADVPELKAAYAAGQDIHAITARQLFGLGADAAVDRDQRGRAKTINFSIIYGISAFGLAQRLGIDRGEAARFIERYFEQFPGIQRYMAETTAFVREHGFVRTLYGRRVNLPLIRSKVMGERQFAERAAINAIVQGTSADIIKRAMIRMGPALKDAGCRGTRMLLQVHDELVFEVPDDEVEWVQPVIRAVMAGAVGPALELSVPLGVEIGVGASWGDAH